MKNATRPLSCVACVRHVKNTLFFQPWCAHCAQQCLPDVLHTGCTQLQFCKVLHHISQLHHCCRFSHLLWMTFAPLFHGLFCANVGASTHSACLHCFVSQQANQSAATHSCLFTGSRKIVRLILSAFHLSSCCIFLFNVLCMACF